MKQGIVALPMQVSMFEHLREQSQQYQWQKPADAVKFVMAMLEIQKRDNIRREAYGDN